jgi:hypothetical protein
VEKINAKILPGTTSKFQVVQVQIITPTEMYDSAEDKFHATKEEAIIAAKRDYGDTDWYVRIIGIVAESRGMTEARKERMFTRYATAPADPKAV